MVSGFGSRGRGTLEITGVGGLGFLGIQGLRA